MLPQKTTGDLSKRLFNNTTNRKRLSAANKFNVLGIVIQNTIDNDVLIWLSQSDEFIGPTILENTIKIYF